jgi:hypothetical protein
MNYSLILFSVCVVFFAGLPYWGSVARLLIEHTLVNLIADYRPPSSAYYNRDPAAQALIVELCRNAHAERDAIRLLKQDVRVLSASDELLKQRVLSLERAADRRNRPQLDGGVEHAVSEHVDVMRRRQEHSDSVLAGLTGELESEKQKKRASAAELRSLHPSQASLAERIDALEEQLAVASAAMASSGREDGHS